MDSCKELTDIQRFYKNSTVFLTGATGFIGKLFLEKVLRALPVKKVFVLVRVKKDVPASKRFQEIFESPCFDLLKRNDPEALKRVLPMTGDCALPGLDLSPEDRRTFIEEVDVIFHCAATVRFDQHIAQATFINVRGTRDLTRLAKEVKKLRTFVYVGTGYSNCNRKEIAEKVYEPKISAEKLIATCESLDEVTLDVITPTLIGDWPNTYTFTKQITEDYINRECRGLPICIARPTIVLSTDSEPIAAFADSVFSFAGFLLGNGLGISRISYYKNCILDIIPADYVINECIAAGWQTGENFKPYKTEIPVYNISTTKENPITQDEAYDYCDYNGRQIPSMKTILYPLYFRTTCKYNYLFWRIFLHNMAAHVIDFGLKLKGKPPQFVGAIQKLHKFQEAYEYFTTHQFFYHTDNTAKMLKKMSFRDRELFNFDVATIKWDVYFSKYVKGARVYILKDPMDTVPEGRIKYGRLKRDIIVGIIIIVIVFYFAAKFLLFKVLPCAIGICLCLLRSAVC